MFGRHCILVAVVSLALVGSAQLAGVSNNVDYKSLVYLYQFGYISDVEGSIPDVSAPIKEFQKMANIPETGVIDSATSAAIKVPRCGVPDKEVSRHRRYTVGGSKWDKNALTYRITQYTRDMNKANVDAEAHFDDSETFTIRTTSGTNLLWVATHTFGHSLGLAHSTIKSAVMSPFYPGYQANFKLHADDIAGIQSIYGKNPVPNFCTGSVDAVMLAAGKTYFFKGDYYVLLNNAGNKIAAGYPRKIAEQWPGLPGGLDAAIAWSNGYTFFFKGVNVWTYKGQMKISGPTPISSRFKNKVLSDVDAAFVWKNNRVYIFKGVHYYRLSSDRTRHDSAYPKSVRLWALGTPIDAVFRWKNGKTYFFVGDKYYRYNDFLRRMESWGALSIGKQWFGGCPLR